MKLCLIIRHTRLDTRINIHRLLLLALSLLTKASSLSAAPPRATCITPAQAVARSEKDNEEKLKALCDAIETLSTDNLIALTLACLKDKFDPTFGGKKYGGIGCFDAFDVGPKPRGKLAKTLLARLIDLPEMARNLLFQNVFLPLLSKRSDSDSLERINACCCIENMITYYNLSSDLD